MDPEVAEAGASSKLKLPLFSKLTSNVGYYNQESPLHVSVSIPFRWEEEPGKPRRCASSCTSMISSSSKSLELPPRLLLLEAAAAAAAKLDSPTTVLEGPYITSKPRSRSSSSFRVPRKDRLHGSLRKSGAGTSPDVGEKGLFGSFRMGRRVKREVGGGDSYVFPSLMEGEGDVNANGGGCFELGRPTGSFSAISHNTRAHFWETIYEGLKQVAHWRSWKSKRDCQRV